MTATNVEPCASPVAEMTTESTSAFPDYLLSPDAVLNDEAIWRFGKAPDYSNTRRAFADSKKMSHPEGSLEDMVQNLVKNWEIEASFKTRLSDWRTIDLKSYTFAINGGPPQDAEHMLRVGTYNAMLAPNSFYSSEHSDFSQSHKAFKRMMPTFAWEVLEVYSGPPRVVFKWRHWGQMKSDYVGLNDNGKKITVKAHGGLLDIQGVTVALVNDKFQVTSLETWFDPLEMFRQFTPREVGVHDKSFNAEAAAHLLQNREENQVFQTETEDDMSGPLVPMEEAKATYPMIEDQAIGEEASAADGLTIVVNPEIALSKHPTGTLFEKEASESITIGSPSDSEPYLPPGHPEMHTDVADSAGCPFLLAQTNTNGPVGAKIASTRNEIEEKATASSIPASASVVEQRADSWAALPACDPDNESDILITASGCFADKQKKETAPTEAVAPLAVDMVVSMGTEGHLEPGTPPLTTDHLDADSFLSPNQPGAPVEVVEPGEIAAPVDTKVVPPFQQCEEQEKAADANIHSFNSYRDLRSDVQTEMVPDAHAARHLVQDESVLQYGHKDSDSAAESNEEPYAGALAETPAPGLMNSEPTRLAPE